MKAEYIQELYDTLDHARKIKGVYKSWERSKTGFKYPEKGAAYKNYLLSPYCDYINKYELKNTVDGTKVRVSSLY
jgi:hypothetical protein